MHTDIDECVSPDMNDCHDSATCHNTEGNYNCDCDDGYDGDGYNCSGRNYSIHLFIPV